MKNVEAFCRIEVGSFFYERSKNFGYALENYGPMQEMKFQKVSKSKAVVVAQVGYGNTRLVGSGNNFGPFKLVQIK